MIASLVECDECLSWENSAFFGEHYGDIRSGVSKVNSRVFPVQTDDVFASAETLISLIRRGCDLAVEVGEKLTDVIPRLTVSDLTRLIILPNPEVAASSLIPVSYSNCGITGY